jgi:hypothetical protein
MKKLFFCIILVILCTLNFKVQAGYVSLSDGEYE